MDISSKAAKSAPTQPEQFKDEREQRGDATAPAPADQFGATEHDVAPLTPPPSAKPAEQPKPSAPEKQKAADEIDPADELTPG